MEIQKSVLKLMKERTKEAEILINLEGCKQIVYKCTAGKLTVGVGCNLEDNGLCAEAIAAQLKHDINVAYEGARQLFTMSEWNEINNDRKMVLMLMVFQMGSFGVSKFHSTLRFIARGDYEQAAQAMLRSKWAKQTGLRARKMANIMRTGIYE